MRLTVPTFDRQGEETSMQKPWQHIALATALVAALGAAPAFAGGPTKASDTKANDTKASSPSASPSMSAGDFVARHTMTGEVTRIDAKRGTMTLKTAEGNLDLHFPPSALSNVKKGDRVTVELAMKPEGGPAASGPSEKTGPASTTDSGKKY